MPEQAPAAPRLTAVRRGSTPDALELMDSAGEVLHLIAYGVTPQEAARREQVLRWLLATIARGPR
ncbi:MAG: hypothetical protein L0027_16735 [Candidatus Rokubacteria bacterium]|nr:hypothetical protein [Candidatus Rokubacteria bacterium]